MEGTRGVSGDSASVKRRWDPGASREAAKEESRRKRAEAREARWAELDARDEAKAKVKEEKALKRKRKKTLKTLKAMEKRRAKEDRMLERYRLRFEKQKARKEARAAKRTVGGCPAQGLQPRLCAGRGIGCDKSKARAYRLMDKKEGDIGHPLLYLFDV